MDENVFNKLATAFKTKDQKILVSEVSNFIIILKQSDLLNKTLRFHPLGFMYSKIHKFQNNDSLRVHIWSKETYKQEPLMDIHNHFYNVNSFVYQGCIINRLFGISDLDSNSVATHSIYSGSYLSNDQRILTRTGSTKKLWLEKEIIINQGSLYEISKSEIHSGSSCCEDFTLTVVYTESEGNPNPLVFGPIEGKSQYQYKSKKVPDIIVNDMKNQITMPNNGYK